MLIKENIVRRFSSDQIIKSYQTLLGIDVSRFFKTDEVLLKLDSELGCDVFNPLDLSGDKLFYQELSKIEWYYHSWKWEHEVALSYGSVANRVLEIGCGMGSFIARLDAMGKEVVGLELGIENRSRPLILNQSVEFFSASLSQPFDLVCGFQVLEHISDPKSFIKAAISCLNEKGKLIFAVPNNNSFIRYSGYDDPLNFPPHHMNRWDLDGFKQAALHFNLKLIAVHFEPLQDYHVDWYVKVFENRLQSKSGLLLKIYKKLKLRKVVLSFVSLLKHKVRGHSMLVVFEKE